MPARARSSTFGSPNITQVEFAGASIELSSKASCAGSSSAAMSPADRALPTRSSQAHPAGLEVCDLLADPSGMGVQFRRGGREEAPAGERAAADVHEEPLEQPDELPQRVAPGGGRAHDVAVEDLARRVDGGEL